MASNVSGPAGPNTREKTGSALTWLIAVLACAYLLWTGFALYFSTSVFINMFLTMGVELPLSTRIVMSFYRLLYPLLFGGAAVLTIAKQFYVRDKWANVSLTLATLLVLNIISQAIVSSLYRPLFVLMEKLSK